MKLRSKYKTKAERKKLFAHQRKVRGWDDSELWSLDYTLAKWLLPRLRRFLEIHVGYPSALKSDKKWCSILRQLIETFELMMKQGDEGPLDKREFVKMTRGLQLFAQYLPNLWD